MKKDINNQLNTLNIHINIDYRESKIIKYFQTIIQSKEMSANYSVNNLPVGDFIFKKGDEILYIIERKSIEDLSSSIIDGRFREQKQRLLESVNCPEKIIYIIEGQCKTKQSIPISTLNSAILNLMFKHKYNVIQTSNNKETYDMLCLLYNKLVNNELVFTEDKNVTINKLIKKSDVINDNVLIHMLSIIPGVSVNIAKRIGEHYKTLPELINKYNLSLDKENMLSEIKVTNKRKLGKILSKKIYNSLFNYKENKENKENNQINECLID